MALTPGTARRTKAGHILQSAYHLPGSIGGTLPPGTARRTTAGHILLIVPRTYQVAKVGNLNDCTARRTRAGHFLQSACHLPGSIAGHPYSWYRQKNKTGHFQSALSLTMSIGGHPYSWYS